MGNLIFLVGAVALSVVGSMVLWLRHRPPSSVMSSIDGFRQEMSALAGERPASTSNGDGRHPPTPGTTTPGSIPPRAPRQRPDATGATRPDGGHQDGGG